MANVATPTTVQAPRRTGSTRPGSRGEWRILATFLAPGVFFYVVFLLVPLLGTIFLSFTSWSGVSFSDIHIVGLSNYRSLAQDPVFRGSLGHTLVFVVVAAVLKTVVALVAALLLNLKTRFSNGARVVLLMPTVISAVVIGAVFTLVLSPSLGLINPIVDALGLHSLSGQWLGSSTRVLPILIVLDVWQNFGVYMLIYIARLLALPEELSEAARVDGASRWQETWRITIPLISSTTGVVLLLSAIDSLKVFTTVYIMTRGGPNHASEVLSTYAYSEAFQQDQVGYGSAILVVLLLISLVFAVIWFRLSRSQED